MVESLKALSKEFLKRMFDIRVGEFRRVILMQLNIFLLILSLLIIKPVINAHFLSIVGIQKLPLVFLLVALAALVVSTVYSRLLNRMALGKIIFRTYLTSILGILTLAILLRLGLFESWIIYLFYISMAIFSLLTTSQFWILANLVFNSLEAKRLFGFISAGAIAGGVGGGYVTSALAPNMDSTNLLFVVVLFLSIGMLINRSIWKKYVPAFNRSIQTKQAKVIAENPIRLIQNSKHLTYLALIVGLSVVVAKLVEYQFSALASARISDPDELAGFFGFWFSTFNVVSLVIQLLLTQRIVGLFGVGKSLFILPGALFLGGLTLLIAPVLWAGIALKMFDISLKQSINKAATELLILPVPMAIKGQAKTFIDVFVDTTATGIGGLLLIFIINGFNLPLRAVSILMLGLILIWVYFALRVRKEYILSFQEKLSPEKETHQKKGFQLSELTSLDGIRKALQTGSEKQLIFLLSRIEENKDQRLMADLLPLLSHSAASVRQSALRCLYYAVNLNVTDAIRPLLRDSDDEVRYRAFSCLLAQSRNNRVDVLNAYLNHEDPVINSAALVGLATEARNNPEMKHIFNLDQLIHDKLQYLGLLTDEESISYYKIMIARAVGYGKLETFFPVLHQFMTDTDQRVIDNAIQAAGNTKAPEFIVVLFSFLINKTTRPTASKALAQYEPDDILPVLYDICQDTTSNTDILIQLPPIAAKMDTQRAVDFLFELMQHRDVAVKLEALQSLQYIKKHFPHLHISNQRVLQNLNQEITLYRSTLAFTYTAQQKQFPGETEEVVQARAELINLLERRLDATLERIFRLLGLKYPPTDIFPVLEGFHHRDATVRANAVDYLDNILEPALKPVLMPLVESALMENLSEEMLERLNIKIPSETDFYHALLKGKDDRIKIAVLDLIATMHYNDTKQLAELVIQDDNPKVSSYAKRLLDNTSQDSGPADL
jgi:AAA family ATP:ADP antiporter